MGPALKPGKNSRVYELRKIFLALFVICIMQPIFNLAHDHCPSRPSKGLMGCCCHNIGKRKWRFMHAPCNKACDMAYICKMIRSNLFADFLEAFELQSPRVSSKARKNHLWLFLHCNFFYDI